MNPTLIVAGLAGLVALGWKFVDFLRLVVNFRTQRSSILTQLSCWASFMVLVWLYGSSQWGDGVIVNGLSLSSMNAATKVITALALGSVASVGVDVKQAIDHTDSAAKPPLLPSAPAPAVPPAA